MRRLALATWLLLPVLAGAYHFGPGQEQMRLDQVDHQLEAAAVASEDGRWLGAIENYDAALALLSDERKELAWQVRLERAKAQMHASKLPQSRESLQELLDELNEQEKVATEIKGEVRAALAVSQYYMTWLMRLEGKPITEWEPEIEAARQNFRLLAERSSDSEAEPGCQDDLESAIRLARMDLSQLQGLPLPSQ